MSDHAVWACVCVITPTILASCPWNIRFSCWLSLSPQPLLPLRPPQLLPCKLQACVMQGFVKLFSINWFFSIFFFLSLGGSIAGCFRSRGSINCRPSIGRRRQTWNRIQRLQRLQQDFVAGQSATESVPGTMKQEMTQSLTSGKFSHFLKVKQMITKSFFFFLTQESRQHFCWFQLMS